MLGQFMLFRALLGRVQPTSTGIGDPEMVDNAYPNYGKRREIPKCKECLDPKCPMPNVHRRWGCESGGGNQLWHGGGHRVFRLEFPDGSISYARLCEVCADMGGNSGDLKDLRRSWFGRRWYYKRTGR